MTMKESSWFRLLVFTTLVVILSIPLYQRIVAAGGSDSPWTYALMAVPALAASICTIMFREKFASFRWWPLRPDLMIAAVVLPIIVETATVAICDAAGFARLDPAYFSVSDGLVSIHKTALLWGAEPQPPLFFVGNFILTVFVASIIYLPMSLGEELGWRGYFQRHSVERLGFSRGVMLLGLVWGYWHAPLILAGHNFPEFPELGAYALMPIATVSLSFALGALYRAARSIWTPALLHGSLNLCADISNRAFGDARDSLAVNLVWIALWALVGAAAWAISARFPGKGGPITRR